MAKSEELVLLLLFLQSIALGTLGCSCLYTHPQRNFCDHNLVLKVRIKEPKDMEVGHGFTMKIIRMFKGNMEDLNVINDNSVDLIMPPACNIDLMKPGDRYVIFGDYQDGMVYTELCMGSTPWLYTSKIFRRGLAKFYKAGCECTEQIGEYSFDKKCHWQYSFLKKRDGNCKWVKTNYFRKCLKGSPESFSWR